MEGTNAAMNSSNLKFRKRHEALFLENIAGMGVLHIVKIHRQVLPSAHFSSPRDAYAKLLAFAT